MLKKKFGLEAIELIGGPSDSLFKIPSILIIPDGCRRIGDCAFQCYKRLKKVVIPESVVRIGDFAFFDCCNADIIVKKSKEKLKLGIGALTGCVVEYVKEEVRN